MVTRVQNDDILTIRCKRIAQLVDLGRNARNAADRSLQELDALIDPELPVPTEPLRSGSAESLMSALGDPSEEVRGQAIASLGEVGASEGEPVELTDANVDTLGYRDLVAAVGALEGGELGGLGLCLPCCFPAMELEVTIVNQSHER